MLNFLSRMTRLVCVTIIASILAGCGGSKPSANTLVIGTIAGPETDLVEIAQQIAQERYGLNVKIVEFSDYNLPNEALEDGTLDANVYQHLPYLKAAIKAHNYELDALGKTFIYPSGIYSFKHKTLNNIPVHGLIAIPNDPSNEARALLLLQKSGLIRLKNNHGTTLAAISANPKNLRFQELDAAQLPRVLADVDAAVINTTFAIPAGLRPTKDALFIENKDSPYANLIVVRKNSPKIEQIKLFIKAMNSNEVKEKAKELFGDAAIPAW